MTKYTWRHLTVREYPERGGVITVVDEREKNQRKSVAIVMNVKDAVSAFKARMR